MTAQPVSLEQMIALMREIRLTTVWQYQQLKIFDAAIEALRASEPVGEDEREALEYVIADNDGWIEAKDDLALRKKHAATLRSLAARLSGAK